MKEGGDIGDAGQVVESYRRAPSAATLAWAANSVEPGARVVGCRRLAGGIIASVHRLTVVGTRGAVHRLVLKRWVEEAGDASHLMVEREARGLAALKGAGLPAPALVAQSRPEETDGHPALLMTQLPGRVYLTPRDRSRWIGQLAGALARVHHLRLDVPLSPPWTSTPEPEVPSWSARPALWRDAARALRDPAPENVSFIHGDYQHFNVLWSRERLTGIVDWTWAGRGHPDRDVGHCRLNLAVLFSPEWAHEFALAYQAEAGRQVERWWDVYEISRYNNEWPRFIPVQAGRRAHVDLEGMNDRVERLLADALSL